MRIVLWLLWAPGIALAQRAPEQMTLAVGFDLDGGPANPDQVVAVAALSDLTAYIVAGQPDVCRPLELTVVDADASITGGALTVTGTDCFGEPLTATWTFDGGGTGVYAPVVVSGTASCPHFKSVTTVSTDGLTGEGGGDTVAVGHPSATGLQYLLYGIRADRGGRKGVDPFSSTTQPSPVTTEGARSTRMRSVAGNQAWSAVQVGDLIRLTVDDIDIERKVVAKISNDEVDVDEGLVIEGSGVGFRVKQPFISTDPGDALWIPMTAYARAAFVVAQRAGAALGDTRVVVECRANRTIVPALSATLAGDDAAVLTLDLERTRYNACRFGLEFDGGDDGDAVPDLLDVSFVGTPR